MFKDLYKGHDFTKITNVEEADSVLYYSHEFDFDHFHIYSCKVCKIIIAIIHTGLEDSLGYRTTYIGDTTHDNWKNVSQNINKILTCDEYIIKDIIQ